MIAAGCKSAAVSPKLLGGPRARNLSEGGGDVGGGGGSPANIHHRVIANLTFFNGGGGVKVLFLALT